MSTAKAAVTTSFTVVCERVGGWWAISVPDLRGVHSQARRLDQVPDMARDAIALMLNVDPATIAVELAPQLPESAEQAVRARRAAAEAERDAEAVTARAVLHLLSDGYTVRDTGAMLQLSAQRISQIRTQAERNGSRKAA